jgi:hypothetical protein
MSASTTPSAEQPDPAVLSRRVAELLMAVFATVIGALVIVGSLEQGIGWGDVGPRPGYFPFYIGLLIVLTSLGTIGLTLARWQALRSAFVGRRAGARVLAVLLPTIVYVIALPIFGMYVASALFITYFMLRHGEHHAWRLIAIPLGVMAFFFITFETWFKVPLPKGPLEALLHLAG